MGLHRPHIGYGLSGAKHCVIHGSPLGAMGFQARQAKSHQSYMERNRGFTMDVGDIHGKHSVGHASALPEQCSVLASVDGAVQGVQEEEEKIVYVIEASIGPAFNLPGYFMPRYTVMRYEETRPSDGIYSYCIFELIRWLSAGRLGH